MMDLHQSRFYGYSSLVVQRKVTSYYNSKEFYHEECRSRFRRHARLCRFRCLHADQCFRAHQGLGSQSELDADTLLPSGRPKRMRVPVKVARYLRSRFENALQRFACFRPRGVLLLIRYEGG